MTNDPVKQLIERYNLSVESHPCAICMAMNDITITKETYMEDVNVGLFRKKKKPVEVEEEYTPRYTPRGPVCAHGYGRLCVDMHKARLKLEFLGLLQKYHV